MQRIKNINLFVSPIVIVAICTVLFFQRKQLAGFEAQQQVQTGIDSLKLDQIYQYAIAYGNYVSVPFHKGMIVTDSAYRPIEIEKLLTNKKFIFHFDETNCFTCVEKFLPYLERIVEKMGKGNVLIIGSYEKSDNLFSTLARFELKEIPVYNLDPVFFRDTKLGELNAPFVFQTDSSLTTEQFFIPEKTAPGLSELYLKKI